MTAKNIKDLLPVLLLFMGIILRKCGIIIIGQPLLYLGAVLFSVRVFNCSTVLLSIRTSLLLFFFTALYILINENTDRVFTLPLLICWLIVLVFLLKFIRTRRLLLYLTFTITFLLISAVLLNRREFHNFYRAHPFEDYIMSRHTIFQGAIADYYIDKYKCPDSLRSSKLLNEAITAQENGDNILATKLFDRALDCNPDDANGYLKRGYFKLTRLELSEENALSAIKDFSRAIRIDTSLTLGYFHRCLALDYVGLKYYSLADRNVVWQRDSILPDEIFYAKYGMSKKTFSIPLYP